MPNVNSAEENPWSLLGADRRASKTQGRLKNHLCGSLWALKTAFKVLCTLSQNPLAWGLYAQVWFSLQPKKLHNSFHKCEVNWTPRSQVNSVGQPNLAAQVCKKCVSTFFGARALKGRYFYVPRKPVNEGHQIRKTVTLNQWAYNVAMYVGKSSVRSFKPL